MERKLWETEEVVFGIASLFLCADLGPWLFLKVRREGCSAAFKVQPVLGGRGVASCPITRFSEQIFLNGRRAEKHPVKRWTRIPTC